MRIVGPLVLVLAIAAGVAVVLNLGGISDKLFTEGEAPKKTAPKLPSAPQVAAKHVEVTPAWYLGASGFEGGEGERQGARAPMLVYFETRACDDCRRFERDVLGTPSVKSFLDGVVKVRIDPNDGAREQKLQQRFAVPSLPGVVVIPLQGPPRVLPPAALSTPQQLIAFAR